MSTGRSEPLLAVLIGMLLFGLLTNLIEGQSDSRTLRQLEPHEATLPGYTHRGLLASNFRYRY